MLTKTSRIIERSLRCCRPLNAQRNYYVSQWEERKYDVTFSFCQSLLWWWINDLPKSWNFNREFKFFRYHKVRVSSYLAVCWYCAIEREREWKIPSIKISNTNTCKSSPAHGRVALFFIKCSARIQWSDKLHRTQTPQAPHWIFSTYTRDVGNIERKVISFTRTRSVSLWISLTTVRFGRSSIFIIFFRVFNWTIIGS